MSERRWPGPSLTMIELTLLAAAVAGCGYAARTAQAGPADAAAAAATGPYTYTASQLKSALLARVGGQRPAAAVQAGAYGALPDVQTSNQARAVTSRRAVPALTELTPAGCAQYTATADGKFFRYSVRAAPLSGVAEQAQALHVVATGYADVDIWSVLYRGSGFIGAVTMVGPDASERGVAQLARDADAYAGQSLSQV